MSLIDTGDAPNWEPLRSVIPAADCDQWMWMHRSTTNDGTVIESYKHRYTRRYLKLSDGGQAWTFHITRDECDPWCDTDHQHINGATGDWVKLDRQAALDWALS